MKVYKIQEPRINEGEPLFFKDPETAGLVMNVFNEVFEDLKWDMVAHPVVTKRQAKDYALKILKKL